MRVGVVVVDADQACQVLLLRVCSGLWLALVYAWRGLFELQGYRCRSVYVRNQLSRTWYVYVHVTCLPHSVGVWLSVCGSMLQATSCSSGIIMA